MYVVCVHVLVQPAHREVFIQATLANAKGTIQEPGNLRFDLLQSKDDPNAFMIYEVYQDEAGMAAHKETPHYAAWAEIANPIMAEPRKGVKYDSLFPEESAQWSTL